MTVKSRPLLLAGMIASFAVAQTPKWEPEIRDAARKAMAQSSVPGLWVVVVDRGQIIVSEALGQASATGPTPLTRQTMVRMAGPGELSINLALFRLSEIGKLDLDAPISRYVQVHPALGRVTANQLIANRSGLRAKHFTKPLWDDADLSQEVRSWDEKAFVANPGETASHSHYGIALGGYLVESIAGKPFPDAMRELVWGPMGVLSGTTRVCDVLTFPIAQGHSVRNGVAEVIRPFGRGFIGWPNGPFLSLNDLDRFALALAKPTTSERLGDRGKWTRSWSWAGIAFTAVVDAERGFCALIADNGSGFAQSSLARTIQQVALGEEPPGPPAAVSWKPVEQRLYNQLVGIYENETLIEIAVRGGKLVLQGGNSSGEIKQSADNVFQAPVVIVEGIPAFRSTFSIEAWNEGKARRLRIGSRVWTRKQ